MFKAYWSEWRCYSGQSPQKTVLFKEGQKILEIGVLEGVTSRNICELLRNIHTDKFTYSGIDLFGTDKEQNNKKEFTPLSNKYSNPLKYIYFNYILRENPNSIETVKNFLKKFGKLIFLYKGYSHNVLKKIDLSDLDFVFLDGGHTYETVKSDLTMCRLGHCLTFYIQKSWVHFSGPVSIT